MLIAATGVGAGDLLTASLAGAHLGVVILWAALAGAILKWFLNEGMARWQMATETTLLEGWRTHLGPAVRWAFLLYFLGWTITTGGAMVGACGVAGAAILPLGDEPNQSKIIWGIAHSLVGAGIVWAGGFRLFERLMGLCTAVMFVSVIATAILLRPEWGEVLRGSVVPAVPAGGGKWVLGVLGGVGGTVTLLSYGYWIREEGRRGADGLRVCRLDLGVGYLLTALFGMSMIIIGSRIQVEGGSGLALRLADRLGEALGPAGKWVFLAGFWSAVFTSLLGVWQSAPFLFVDLIRRSPPTGAANATQVGTPRSTGYRAYLLVTALGSLPLLWGEVKTVQLAYAVLGAMFMPFVAVTLLLMNNRRAWVGERFRNGAGTNAALIITLVVFVVVGGQEIVDSIRKAMAGP